MLVYVGLSVTWMLRWLQVRDAGNLLTRANLAIPSVDTDELTVQYRSMDELQLAPV